MSRIDHGVSRAEFIANLRDDARFYRRHAAALRSSADSDEKEAARCDAEANRLEATAEAKQP